MQENYLKLDRFLQKAPSQNDSTKGAAYVAQNPAPKRGEDHFKKIGRPKGSEEDGGTPNVLTGTVITSCFIQTSALPSRIELEGNDLTFFDDTYAKFGKIVGDTSRLVFTHGSAKRGKIVTEGFIFEKRASFRDTYDNVLSLYGTTPKAGSRNYLFIGRDGVLSNSDRFKTNAIALNVNYDSSIPYNSSVLNNGVYQLTYSVDGTPIGILFAAGRTEEIFGQVPGYIGYSTFIGAYEGGFIITGAKIVPALPSLDIGTATEKFGTIYAENIDVSNINAENIDVSTITNTGITIGSIQRITGPGAINITTPITALTTTGLSDAYTLPNGVDGQMKYICIEVDGGSAIITPTLGNGFTTCTLNGIGDGVMLIFLTGVGWTCVGENSATFA